MECKPCTTFFAKYRCGASVTIGECDCPRCQGYCRCGAVIAAKYAVEGFGWSCDCGEAYNSERAAWNCRKCVRYLSEQHFPNRTVSYMSPEEAAKLLIEHAG